VTAYHVCICFVTCVHMVRDSIYLYILCAYAVSVYILMHDMCVCFLTLYPLYMIHPIAHSLPHNLDMTSGAQQRSALSRRRRAPLGLPLRLRNSFGFHHFFSCLSRKMSFSFFSSFSTLHSFSPFFSPLFLLFGLAGSHAIRWYWWSIPWESWYAWY